MKWGIKIITFLLLPLGMEYLPVYPGELGCHYPEITNGFNCLAAESEPLVYPSGYLNEKDQSNNAQDQQEAKAQPISIQAPTLSSKKGLQCFYRYNFPKIAIPRYRYEVDRAPPKYIFPIS